MQEPVDIRQEQSLLQKAADAEARFRSLIEQKRRALYNRRKELEATLAIAEQELEREQAAVTELQAEVSLEQWEGREQAKSLASLLPELESAHSAVRQTEDAIIDLRRKVLEQAAEEQKQLETAKSLYEIYAAATGIRWDTESTGVEGYVALNGIARPFEVHGRSQQETADLLWAEVEACLPQQSPWHPSAIRGGA